MGKGKLLRYSKIRVRDRDRVIAKFSLNKKMNFDEYQKKSRKTAIYPDKDRNFIYPTLGLMGESGEIAEKIKKVIRDKGGKIDEETRTELIKELGDVLWYLANLSTELGISLDKIAVTNIEKLLSRMQRDKLHGDGDNR